MNKENDHLELVSRSSKSNGEIPKQVWDDIQTLQKQIQGEIEFDEVTLTKYSHDTSIFEIKPLAVVFPKNSLDIAHIVKFVQDKKNKIPHLAITPRSGGSDMTGGAIGQGLIIDVTRHMKSLNLFPEEKYVQVEPGVFYKDFEPEGLTHDLIMPVAPASRNLAAFGGMISNNCAGEKSLLYGQMRNFVESMECVLSNGREYEFKELNFDQVNQIINGSDEYLAGIYRQTFNLINENYNFIKNSKPKTRKNSSGYALWDVMDRDKRTFDLTQLFTGAQGTLGIITDSKIRLVEQKDFTKIITVFLPSWKKLPHLVNSILPIHPESLEVFDDTTLKLGLRFFPQIAKRAGKSLISLIAGFIPEFFIGVRMFGLPKLIVIIELTANSKSELEDKIKKTERALRDNKVIYRIIPTTNEAEKYFLVRRESFNLLREKVKGKNTAPFIEDFAVQTDVFPEFLPKLIAILKKHKINVNISGHAGDGNLHIIPLMNFKDESERAKIVPVAQEVYDLIISYGGTITAEHNDGIMGTPFIKKMYGERMNNLFKEIKYIFDPNNIFNPGKKIGGTIEDIERWMKRE